MTKRASFFLLVSALFSQLAILGQNGPSLTVEPPNNGQIRISWTGAASGYQLQETSALGNAWQPSGALPVLQNNEYVLTFVPQGTAKFFRLVNVGGTVTQLESSSPADGETGVAVTRETILRFSAPL